MEQGSISFFARLSDILKAQTDMPEIMIGINLGLITRKKST